MAQISDLEYRIRQHTDLHSQIRRTKGPVHLSRKRGVSAELSSPLGSPNEVLLSPQSVNGYRGQLPGNSSSYRKNDDGMDGFVADVEDDGQSCRTRSFQRTTFKKRKLLQTVNLHTISKKAAKPR